MKGILKNPVLKKLYFLLVALGKSGTRVYYLNPGIGFRKLMKFKLF